MKTIKQICCTITLITLITVDSFGNNKNESKINLKGIITNACYLNSTENLKDVTINVYQFNRKVNEFGSEAMGQFNFEIPNNEYIVVEFLKDGFVPKRLLFDTRNKMLEIKKSKPFDLEIALIPIVSGVDFSELDFPITMVYFNNQYKDYQYDDKYTSLMLKIQTNILKKVIELTEKNNSK